MWTEITRSKYERAGRRYASDLADAEWRLIEPYMPALREPTVVWQAIETAWISASGQADIRLAPAGSVFARERKPR
jgi:hypothetical protein